MNIETFETLWTNTYQDKEEQTEFWNQRATSFNQHKKNPETAARRGQFVAQVMASTGLSPDCSVLDIGCGTGHYALELAKAAGEVTAFDLSPNMIDLARLNAQAAGQGRINFQVLDWDKADLKTLGWENKFDLTFASRTPAINNRATLEKMMAASKQHCVIVSLADDYNSSREELKPLINYDQESERLKKSFYLTFNMLWLMGYYPEVRYVNYSWEEDCPLEDAIAIHTRYLGRTQSISQTAQEALVRRLTEMAIDGKIHEKSYSKVVLLHWQP